MDQTINPKVEYVKSRAREIGFECDIFYHEESGRTTADAEKALGIDPSHIIKCLLLKSKNDEYVAAIVRGSDRVSFSSIESLSGFKGLRMAGSDDLQRELGFEIGGVPAIVFHEKNIRTFVDKKVIGLDYVVGSGGTPHHGMRFNPKYLIDKLNYEAVNIT